MDEAGFWYVVQRAHDASGGDMDRKCAELKRELMRLPKGEAAEFATHFDAMMNRAYDWPLWGAAYVINGGCSDDAFQDFRAALISRGQAAYESALFNPESLAGEDFDEDLWFYEGFAYAVTDGVEAAAGMRPRLEMPAMPSGAAWEEASVDTLYPKLAAKFG